MPENREVLLVMKATKVPVASSDGVRTVIRAVRPGEYISRADWDRFPARSRRSMVNTGFVKDPLSVEINPITSQPVPLPEPKPSVTVYRPVKKVHKLVDGVWTEVVEFPAGRDPFARRQIETAPARRGRPKGSKNKPKVGQTHA